MSFKYCLALALLPCAAGAQQGSPAGAHDPADAQQRVPAAAYASAFKDYRSAADQEATPDQAWRGANARVEKEGGHGMHAAMPMPAPVEQPASKATPGARIKSEVNPHAGHEGHQ
jgi:hypothetical protein